MRKSELFNRFWIRKIGTGTYKIQYVNERGTYTLVIQESPVYDNWVESTLADLLHWRKMVLRHGTKKKQ